MLSPSQQEAVCHGMGPCLTLAGPGSGKTYVLIRRIQYLITNYHVLPENILVITFTKAAAHEMKERFDGLMEQECPVVFGTFHSVFYGMLRQDSFFRNYRLMDQKTKRQILKETAYACKLSTAEEEMEHMEQEISFIKNTMCDPSQYESAYFSQQTIQQIYAHYEARKDAYELFDFDDLLVKTKDRMQKNPAFLEKWQKRFSYILVDEVQDMNPLQFDMIRLLALPENNLFMVGDDDQSIYGFRGANPELMFSFSSYYPEIKQIQLQENYRCEQKILEASQHLISHNEKRFFKEINGIKAEEGVLECVEVEDEKQEMAHVIALLKTRQQEENTWENCAVLYRNHRQITLLLSVLAEQNIPFYVKDHMQNSYMHFVMQDIVSYLRLCSPMLHRRDLFRVMNRPNRYLQRASVTKEWITFSTWKSYYEKQPQMQQKIEVLERDLSFLKTLSGKAAVTFICKRLGYEDYLLKEAKNKEQYDEWKEIVELFKDAVKDIGTIGQMLLCWEEKRDFVERINREKVKDKAGKVGLYTLHGSKGLEFETVIILDCNETILPTKKAITAAAVEEERRLFYVGMTRAKKRLYLLYVQAYEDKKMHPSRFLEEMQKVQKRH